MTRVGKSMVSFLFAQMFFIDLIVVGFIATAKLPKRTHFGLRMCLALAGGMAFSYIWGHLPWFGNMPLVHMLVNYTGVYVVAMLALAVCVRMERGALLYIGPCIWFIQHSANCIDFAFLGGTMSLANFLRHELLVLGIALLVYVLLLRKLDSYTLSRISPEMAAPTWLSMCFVCLFLNSRAMLLSQATQSFYLADLMCNVVGLLYQGGIYYSSGIRREQEETERLLRESEAQYKLSAQNAELINIKSHDLRYLLRQYQRQSMPDKAAIEQIEKTVDVYDSAVNTCNTTLDVLLNEKSRLCLDKGIGFTCLADASGLEGMAAADLYALFGNAMDNAIEAVSQLSNASKKYISLTIRRMGDLTTVILQNYTSDKLTFVDGLPLTTKADKANHGFGVKSIHMLVAKYEGEMRFSQEDDIVTLTILLPKAN